MAEHLTFNQGVLGSSPRRLTTFRSLRVVDSRAVAVSRRWLLRSLPLGLLAVPAIVRAQPQRHIVGVLRVGKPPASFVDGLRQGLRDAGRPEGASLAIEYGIAQSAGELPKVARELLDRKISVLIASGTPSVLPATTAPSSAS